jgi:transcriptional regulator with XRE-family HTH domain
MYYIRDMDTLAKRLIWAREQKGLTQAALAKLSGVTQSTIGNLESGIRSSARRIVDIAAALNVNPNWLANGQGNATEAEPNMLSVAEPSAQYNAITDGPRSRPVGRDANYMEDVSLSSETTLERLNAREKMIIELYRRSSEEGKLMIYGACKAAAEYNDASFVGRSE